MVRKRPCGVCRRWFMPHRRVGERQQYCGDPACQRERHRRACKTWRDQNPDYDREDRLRRKLRARPDGPVAETEAGLTTDPQRRLDWSAARDAVGLETAVIIEESGQVLVDWVRDAVGMEVRVLKEESRRLLGPPPRDGDGVQRPPPQV